MLKNQNRKQRPLSVKLLIATWAISSFATLFFTAIQVFSDYNRDYKKLTHVFEIVEKSYLQPISEYLWSYDNRLIEIQLDGLTQLEGVSHLRLMDLTREIYSKGLSNKEVNLNRTFKIYHGESRELLGSLEIEVDVDSLKDKYVRELFWIFIRQASKTLIVVFILYFVFNHIIVAPLEHISRYLRLPDADKSDPLALNRPKSIYYDELDLLVDNINEYSDLSRQRVSSLSNLTAGITNEISAPLENIYQNSSLLKDSISEISTANTPEQINHGVQELQNIQAALSKNTLRIQSVIKTIQLFTGNPNVTFSIIDLEQVIQEALRNTKFKLEKFEVVEVTKVKLDLVDIKIRAQKKQFVQALENILENSFYALSNKYRELGPSFVPEIHIQTEVLKDKVRISIWDNGTGIGIEAIDKIFNPFFTTKPAGEGTGLGLTIAFDVIRKQGGKLRLADTNKNEFTHMVIELPLSSRII